MNYIALQNWRVKFGYSPLEAGEVFGLSERQYKRIENGACPVPPYVLIIVGLLVKLDGAGITL